jgi:hypothetical protein
MSPGIVARYPVTRTPPRGRGTSGNRSAARAKVANEPAICVSGPLCSIKRTEPPLHSEFVWCLPAMLEKRIPINSEFLSTDHTEIAMLNQITCRSLTFLLALAAGIGLLSTPLAHADKQHDLSDPTAWTYFSNADSSACASDCAAVLREARYAAWSLCAASTSVAHIVRIAEPVARASTTAGVLHQDDAPQ